MKREAYFDNAKFILIFLVVFGHFIQPLTSDSQAVEGLYKWVYSFHMPAFIFLAGFFAKGLGNKQYVMNLIKKLLYPYLLFQLFYSVYYFFIGEKWMTSIFHPHWSLWFLFSLFCWHMMLCWFKRLSPLLGISVAVLLGLSVGYIDSIGHQFSLSRTVVFFPYFLIGYWLTKEQLFRLRTPLIKGLALVVMGMAALMASTGVDFTSDWFLGSKSYETLGLPVAGAMARLGVYLAAVLMSVSVLVFIPRGEKVWSAFGQRTLYVYLLHGFFIQYIRVHEEWFYNHSFVLISSAFMSLGIVLLLSTRLVMGVWQPFIEGKAPVMKRKVYAGKEPAS